MMTAGTTLRMVGWDVRLQVRYGFYTVYAVLTVAYVLGLALVPPAFRERTLALLVLTDPSVLGFYFVSALVLVEKREGTLDALAVSPLGVRGYLLAKLCSLSALAVAASVTLALLAHPRGVDLPLLVGGVALTSAFFVSVGLVAVSRFDTIEDYFFSALGYGAVMFAPLLGYLGLLETPLFWLLPARPARLLVAGAFEGIATWELAYAVGYLLVGTAVCLFVARRRFERDVLGGRSTGRSRVARAGTGGRPARWLADRTGPVGALVLADLRNWARDPILLLAGSGPFALALLGRLALPVVDTQYLPSVELEPLYPTVLVFVFLFPGYVLGMVVGFLVLEDREEGVLDDLRRTPLTGRGYLRYRGTTAYLLAFGATLVVVPLFGLVAVSLPLLVATAAVAGLVGPAVVFLFAALASDAIEGLALNKLLGLVVLLPPVGLALLPEPLEYVVGVVPLYWPAKALLAGVEGGSALEVTVLLAVGVLALSLSLAVLVRRFERRVR